MDIEKFKLQKKELLLLLISVSFLINLSILSYSTQVYADAFIVAAAITNVFVLLLSGIRAYKETKQ